MRWVALRVAAPRWACLCEITGRVEHAVGGTSVLDALELLDGVLVAMPGGAVGPGEATKLAAPDRDRLLAAVYTGTYGPRVESTVTCESCASPFDLDFSLDEFRQQIESSADANGITADTDGTFATPSGARFRFPTGADEIAAAGLPMTEAATALMRASIPDASDAPDAAVAEFADVVQAGMNAVAPLLQAELGAVCPECGAHHEIWFDIQHYLLSSLLAEQPRLDREIHALATAYGWGLGEILDLPRRRRRALVAVATGASAGVSAWWAS